MIYIFWTKIKIKKWSYKITYNSKALVSCEPFVHFWSPDIWWSQIISEPPWSNQIWSNITLKTLSECCVLSNVIFRQFHFRGWNGKQTWSICEEYAIECATCMNPMAWVGSRESPKCPDRGPRGKASGSSSGLLHFWCKKVCTFLVQF